MNTVLLCGGRGVRFSEETNLIPKPMIQIGNLPILMHLIKIYNHYNIKDFILCLGYKQEIIREYFLNFNSHNSDMVINLKEGNVEYFKKPVLDSNIHLIDTGENTLTGGRLLKIKDYIKEDIFLVNYSDGLSNININELIRFHKSHGKIATLTAVKKQGKFGTIQVKNDTVTSFKEKPVDDDYINGGFFCFSKKIFDYIIDGDFPETLDLLAKNGQLIAYKFKGFLDCVDTLNDKIRLEKMCNDNQAPWKVWND